jgi:hypothetical protein
VNRPRGLARTSLARRPGSPSNTSLTTGRPEVWEAWLSLAFIGVIAGGLVLVVAPDWAALGWLNRGAARAFFGDTGPPAGAEALRRWLYGVEGATLVAFGILGLAITRTALRQGESWGWRALTIAVGAWFVLDTPLSLAYGVPENAALNVVIALVILAPVVALRPPARAS